MARYIDADLLYKETAKKIKANSLGERKEQTHENDSH